VLCVSVFGALRDLEDEQGSKGNSKPTPQDFIPFAHLFLHAAMRPSRRF